MKKMTFATMTALALLAGAVNADDVTWQKSGDFRIGGTRQTSVTPVVGNSLDTEKGLTAWISATTYASTTLMLTGKDGVVLETRSVNAMATPISLTFPAPLGFTGIKISATTAGSETLHYQLMQTKAAR